MGEHTRSEERLPKEARRRETRREERATHEVRRLELLDVSRATEHTQAVHNLLDLCVGRAHAVGGGGGASQRFAKVAGESKRRKTHAVSKNPGEMQLTRAKLRQSRAIERQKCTTAAFELLYAGWS